MANAPSGSTTAKGQRLGRYELLGEIASGGMATVYLGRALGVKGFARLVAIKRLHPHLEREEEFVSMFLDEARLAARIRHPHVVPTLDVDDQDGLYIVMEYIEGDRLLGLLRYASRAGERIPAAVALRIATETLSGLHAAHELLDDDGNALNLVHRDVSPQNVLIGIDGVTKITDFGIAKAESRLTSTRDGQLKGKISYMAPEQTRGGEIDRRVDVFAMGILTWEMLSAQRLFHGDNDVEVLNGVLNAPIPSVRSVVPEIPTELDKVVMKALERDRTARWTTAAEFADALEHASGALGGLAPTRGVATYVQKVAGPKLEQERTRLRAGIPTTSATEPPGASRPFSSERSGIGVRGTNPKLPTGGDVLDEVETTPETSPMMRFRNRKFVVPAAVVVVLVAGFGAWALLWTTDGHSRPPPASSHTATVPALVASPTLALVPPAVAASPPVQLIPLPSADAGASSAANPVAAHPVAANGRGPARAGGGSRRGARRPASDSSHSAAGNANASHAAGSHGGGSDDDLDPMSQNPYRRN